MVSLISTRHAILRPKAARTTVFLLAIVTAIVLGLLAMHTVASAIGSHSDAATSVMTMESAAHHTDEITGGNSAAQGLVDCVGICAPGNSMASMVCILVLLFTALVVVAARAGRGSALLPLAWPALNRIVAFAALNTNPPPSLHALSISST